MRQLILAAGLLAALGCATQPSELSVKEVSVATTTASGQPIRLPGGDVRIVLSTYVIPAGAKLPVHKHLHTRLAYVQEGTIAVTNVDTNQTARYGPGDLVVESVDQWHFGVNTGDVPVRLLVLDEVPIDVKSNVVKRD
ncbi:MAG TPA: cupin domain-containing protein [Planctomycetota bacterium]